MGANSFCVVVASHNITDSPSDNFNIIGRRGDISIVLSTFSNYGVCITFRLSALLCRRALSI